MNLIEKIDEKYKISIKEKDSNSINTLRLIKSAIKDKQILLRAKQENLSEGEILGLLQNLIKQRKDSIEQFEKANRDDLIKNEQSEIDVINQYLPNQKTEEETEKIIDHLIKAHNLENLKDMGKLMGFVKKDYPGEVDMGLVSKIAKSKLSI